MRSVILPDPCGKTYNSVNARKHKSNKFSPRQRTPVSIHAPNTLTSYETAVRDFTDARKREAFRRIINRVTGESDELLSYNEVRQQLLSDSEALIEGGVQEIPLASIVGSVGRYKDFTRDFLPKRDSDKERWARVRASVIDMRGWSPIEVYQIGEVYFVKDGNHRVSVARQMGVPTITANVTTVNTNVDLKPDDNPGEVIARANYAAFLERTQLQVQRPEADLSMTLAGGYRELLHEIETYGRIAEQKAGKSLSAEYKAAQWYDNVYIPVINLMREQGLTHTFSRRTETDLYVMLTEHREELEDELGLTIDSETAAVEWADQQREEAQSPVIRLGKRLRDAVIPNNLEDGPEPGLWRQTFRKRQRLFRTILVALEGIEADEQTLAHALKVAKWEKAHVNGIHLVNYKHQESDNPHEPVAELFQAELAGSKIKGDLTLVSADIECTPIIDLARWSDLVVVSLTNPPGPNMGGRRGNQFIRLIQQSPRPILAVPGVTTGAESTLSHALVAYDGSPKADEALFMACYAAQKWGTALTVLTVETNHTSAEALAAAQEYLDGCGVRAIYELREQHIADALLDVSAESDCDWLIMGGFGFRPMKHLMLGSTVDRMLREFRYPMLICR